MSSVPFDDPAGRTRFAWARTLLVAFAASLLVERLFFVRSFLGLVVLVLPVATLGTLALIRSRPLRQQPRGFSFAIPVIVLLSVLLVAMTALWGVAESL